MRILLGLFTCLFAVGLTLVETSCNKDDNGSDSDSDGDSDGDSDSDSDGDSDYDCAGMVSAQYEAGCEMWCENDADYVYVDTCGWYDDGAEENFSQDDAEWVCGEYETLAADMDCEAELQDLLNCAGDDAENCAENCLEEWTTYSECVWPE
jgi:hypothetical protein